MEILTWQGLEIFKQNVLVKSPPAPNSGGARTQSPPELGDLGGIQQLGYIGIQVDWNCPSALEAAELCLFQSLIGIQVDWNDAMIGCKAHIIAFQSLIGIQVDWNPNASHRQ